MRNQQLTITTVLVAAACLAAHRRQGCVDAFAPSIPSLGRHTNIFRMSSTENENAETSADAETSAATGPGSFDDSAKAIRAAQDAEAMERGSGMSEEEKAEFQSRGAEFSSMKDLSLIHI